MPRFDWKTLFLVPVLTAPAVAHATDYLNIAEAQRALIPQADGFAPVAITLNVTQLGQIKKLAGVPQRNAQPRVWRATHGGHMLGWVIVDQVIGKHEFITYATAISPDGKVMGIEVMRYVETKGDQVRQPKWRALFRGKALGDKFKLNQDIPNISGATLSCRNITDGVKRLLALHSVALS